MVPSVRDLEYKITTLQKRILTYIVKQIIRQSTQHENNIVEFYSIMTREARKQFNEDNKPTLDGFLTDCFQESLKEK